jgi:hypothetical protein
LTPWASSYLNYHAKTKGSCLTLASTKVARTDALSCDPVPVVACLKWGLGYPGIYTNVLYRALRERLHRTFRFVCITDDPRGLDRGIETVPLPDFALPREHWVPMMWPKLSVFKPGLFALGTPVLLLDVDVVVLSDPGVMFDRLAKAGGIHTIHDWPRTTELWLRRDPWALRRSNSSAVGFVAGEQNAIWEAFHNSTHDELRAIAGNDQAFIHAVGVNQQYWPHAWTPSFKKTLCRGGPWRIPARILGRVPLPPDAVMVIFHGKPDPADLARPPLTRWGSPETFGYFPVPWVREYWRHYSREAPDSTPSG